MFNNLIESSSHKGEFKRRGSFVLFTAATYFLLFVIAGVMSIYAYDARLDDPNTEIVVMLPLDLAAPPTPIKHNAPPPKGKTSEPNEVVRQTAMASVNNPQIVPEKTSVTANKNLPVPDRGPYTIGDRDSGPVELGGDGGFGSASNGQVAATGTGNIEVGTPPPAVPVEKSVPRVVSKGVINGEALSLPRPIYPLLAKQLRIQGTVSVQILIDEAGKVISAKVVSGNPSLAPAARQAAFGARFSPTRLSDQPVKVSGVITYNFLLQ